MEPGDRGQLNELLLSLRGGDAKALDAVFSCIGGRMYALALGIVRNRQDAEDVVSESFIKLARGIRGYRADTNAYAFVMRIVRNCAFDLLRRRKVRAEEDIDAFFHLTDGRYDGSRIERAAALEDAVSRLTKEERAMIYYRYYLDLTVREIAAETGKSKSAVGRLVTAAEEKLKELLSEGQTEG